jgi:hypothetical protein
MISDKAYKEVMKTKNAIEKALLEHDIKFETLGDEYTISYAGTCEIYTLKCTIEIHNTDITVNEQQIGGINELIEKVLDVEFG